MPAWRPSPRPTPPSTPRCSRGYQLVTGNHYEAPSGDDTPEVRGPPGSRHQWSPDRTHRLRRARLRRHPRPDPRARLRPDSGAGADAVTTGETLRFEVPVPNVKQAVVLKALAWHSCPAAKDIADLCTLCRSPTNTETDSPTGHCTPPARMQPGRGTSWSPCSTAAGARCPSYRTPAFLCLGAGLTWWSSR